MMYYIPEELNRNQKRVAKLTLMTLGTAISEMTYCIVRNKASKIGLKEMTLVCNAVKLTLESLR